MRRHLAAAAGRLRRIGNWVVNGYGTRSHTSMLRRCPHCDSSFSGIVCPGCGIMAGQPREPVRPPGTAPCRICGAGRPGRLCAHCDTAGGCDRTCTTCLVVARGQRTVTAAFMARPAPADNDLRTR